MTQRLWSSLRACLPHVSGCLAALACSQRQGTSRAVGRGQKAVKGKGQRAMGKGAEGTLRRAKGRGQRGKGQRPKGKGTEGNGQWAEGKLHNRRLGRGQRGRATGA